MMLGQALMVDIDSSDGVKQYNALVKVVTHAMNRPQDIHPFLEQVCKHCLFETRHSYLRATTYQLLRNTCEAWHSTSKKWDNLLGSTLKDVESSDAELQISSLKMLCYIPLSKMISHLELGRIALIPCLANHVPSVRREALITIAFLFTRRFDHRQVRVFAPMYIPAMCTLMWEEADQLVLSALFEGFRDLVAVALGDFSFRAHEEALVPEADSMRYVVTLAARQFSRARLLFTFARCTEFSAVLQSRALPFLAYVLEHHVVSTSSSNDDVAAPPGAQDDSAAVKQYENQPPLDLDDLVERYFLPLCTAPGRLPAWSACVSTLRLSTCKTPRMDWIVHASRCLLARIPPGGGNSVAHRTAARLLMEVFPLIPQSHMMYVMIPLLSLASRLSDALQTHVVVEAFLAYLRKTESDDNEVTDMESSRKFNGLLTALIDSTVFAADSFRILIALCLFDCLDREGLANVDLVEATSIAVHLSDCFEWEPYSKWVVQRYLAFIDSLFVILGSQAEICTQLLVHVRDRYAASMSDPTLAQFFLLASKYASVNELSHGIGDWIIEIASTRIFPESPIVDNEQVQPLTHFGGQNSLLISSANPSSEDPVVHDQNAVRALTLRALQVAALRCDALRSAVMRVISLEASKQEKTPLGVLYSMAEVSLRGDAGNLALSPDVSEFCYLDEWCGMVSDDRIALNVCQNRLFEPSPASFWKTLVAKKRTNLKWTTISGSSAPISVSVAHLMNLGSSRVTLHLRAYNATQLRLRKVRIMVHYSGMLRPVGSTDPAVFVLIDDLKPDGVLEHRAAFDVLRVGEGRFDVRITFEDEGESIPIKARYLDSKAVNCTPYQISLVDLLFPVRFSMTEWNLWWTRLSASLDYSVSLPGHLTTAHVLREVEATVPLLQVQLNVSQDAKDFRAHYSGASCLGDGLFLAFLQGTRSDSSGKWQLHWQSKCSDSYERNTVAIIQNIQQIPG